MRYQDKEQRQAPLLSSCEVTVWLLWDFSAWCFVLFLDGGCFVLVCGKYFQTSKGAVFL